MKRYALFYTEHYYPDGGWRDFHSTYDTLIEAEQFAHTLDFEDHSWHVVDLHKGKIMLDSPFPSCVPYCVRQSRGDEYAANRTIPIIMREEDEPSVPSGSSSVPSVAQNSGPAGS